MLYLPQSYPTEFAELFMHLKAKYPAALFDMEGIGKQTDMSKFSRDFFAAGTTADASIDANANVSDKSSIAYHVELPKPFLKLNSYYMLWKGARRLYGQEVANTITESQLVGDIYINDFVSVGAGQAYCFNFSTYDIMLLGMPMIDKVKSLPPKHLYAFKSQLEQFVTIASNSIAGAAGLADLMIVLSLYMRRILKVQGDAHFRFADEESCWAYLRETMVSFIYTLNQPMRGGQQSPFTNVSLLSHEFLENLCGEYIDPETGEPADIELVKQIQILFLESMNEEQRRTPITFPITSACFATDDENNIQDKEFVKTIAKYNAEYGFINLYCGKSSTLSSCCRLRSETVNEYFNSFGAGSTKIGSLGVCTLNLPRLANKHAGDEDAFLEGVKALTGLAQRINNVKRSIVKRRIAGGTLPLYTLGFMDLSKQYSTLGVNGLNECLELMGYDILTSEGQDFVIKILECINAENAKCQKKYGAPHNCEQIPGEGASVSLAKKDTLLGFNSGGYVIYSNQFIPLTTNADVLDRIHLQGLFDGHFSGGSICHINLDTRVSVDRIEDLIHTVAKQGVVYWAMNFKLQRCDNGHMTVGSGRSCNICGGEIVGEYTRIVGYLVSVANWSKERRELDYPNRVFYDKA
jgi:ribonucleoside-triphosphate reductase